METYTSVSYGPTFRSHGANGDALMGVSGGRMNTHRLVPTWTPTVDANSTYHMRVHYRPTDRHLLLLSVLIVPSMQQDPMGINR